MFAVFVGGLVVLCLWLLVLPYVFDWLDDRERKRFEREWDDRYRGHIIDDRDKRRWK